MSAARRPGGRARAGLVVAAGLVVLAVVLAATLTGGHHHPAAAGRRHPKSHRGQPTPTPAPLTGPPLPAARIGPVQGPQPPRSGAWLGAFVQPSRYYTQAGQIAAVEHFELQLGRRLDVIHQYRRWEAPFPTTLDSWATRQGQTVLISWASADTRLIAAGRFDALIRARAEALKALRAPVFLEFRWEMDRPNLRYLVHSPADFIAAWRRVHAIFQQVGATNVGWVWCPTAVGFQDGRAPAYYPGNSEVDWVCVDAYPGSSYDNLAQTLGPFLAWAKSHPKPVMVGEFGEREGPANERPAWIAGLAVVAPRMRSVKAYLYFDSNVGGSVHEARLAIGDSPASLAAFRRLADDPYFHTLPLAGGQP